MLLHKQKENAEKLTLDNVMLDAVSATGRSASRTNSIIKIKKLNRPGNSLNCIEFSGHYFYKNRQTLTKCISNLHLVLICLSISIYCLPDLCPGRRKRFQNRIHFHF